VAAVRDDGVDMRRFSREVVGYLRELLLVKAGAADTLDQSKETLAEMQALAKQAGRAEIVSALKTLGRLDFRDDPQSSLPLELALVELVSDEEKPVERPAPPPEKAVPAPTEPGEPQFSIPVSSAEEVAATATGATVDAPEPEAAEEAGAMPLPAGVPADPSAISGQAPSASSGQAPSTGSGQALLARVREACKETDKQLAALLNASCEVKSLEGDVLTLGFYHTFHLERMEAGGYASRLSELLSQELGRPVTAELVHSPRRPAPGRVKSGHLVQAARELGAKPIGEGAQQDDGEPGAQEEG
jgi:DNA polymerase-3 subunit gamma/tau